MSMLVGAHHMRRLAPAIKPVASGTLHSNVKVAPPHATKLPPSALTAAHFTGGAIAAHDSPVAAASVTLGVAKLAVGVSSTATPASAAAVAASSTAAATVLAVTPTNSSSLLSHAGALAGLNIDEMEHSSFSVAADAALQRITAQHNHQSSNSGAGVGPNYSAAAAAAAAWGATHSPLSPGSGSSPNGSNNGNGSEKKLSTSHFTYVPYHARYFHTSSPAAASSASNAGALAAPIPTSPVTTSLLRRNANAPRRRMSAAKAASLGLASLALGAATAAASASPALAEPKTPPPTPDHASAAAAAATATPPVVISSPTNAGAALIPHPAKAAKGGEDAVFISSTGRYPMVLAVADGVGGWADRNVDAGLFSRALLAGVEYRLRATFGDTNNGAQPSSPPAAAPVPTPTQLAALPLDLLQFGYDHVRTEAILGSCTACVVVVHDQTLHARNLGDSGFMVLRRTGAGELKPVLRSSEQQHSFNFPKQLACSEGHAEVPSDADIYHFNVQTGDIIVLGTDGLFDNLHDARIARVIHDAIKPPAAQLAPASPDTRAIAKALALEAHRVASSTAESTPFAESARRHGHYFAGGKMDDISVVVSVV